MITRDALKICLQKAKDDLEKAPADGMLEYLIREKALNKWVAVEALDDIRIVALAYSYAVAKDAMR